MNRGCVLLVGALALLGGCSDKSTAPKTLEPNTLRFTYTGGGGGTYTAPGTVSAGLVGNFAFAVRDGENGLIVVSAVDRPDGRQNLVVMLIPRLTTGSSTIRPDCFDSDGECAAFALGLGVSGSEDDADFFCTLATGTLAISAISNNRATGTFSGVGVCATPTDVESAFTVTGGTYDIPIISGSPFGVSALEMAGIKLQALR